jgi:hypothetical protein
VLTHENALPDFSGRAFAFTFADVSSDDGMWCMGGRRPPVERSSATATGSTPCVPTFPLEDKHLRRYSETVSPSVAESADCMLLGRR